MEPHDGSDVTEPDDDRLAAHLAQIAGDLLMRLREELGFDDPGELRAAGDKRSHDLLMGELARLRPGDAVLSEEGVHDDPARRTADRVWIIDPLDGTREFGEPGRDDWAVHVALCSGGELAVGAVALPAMERVLTSAAPPAPVPAREGSPRIVTSRTRPPQFLPAVAEALGAVLVPMGSAGAKIAAVVTGDADAYVHAGGQYEWDSAAPVAVARAAGLHASRIDGAPLRYNGADAYLPDLVVCRPELADDLLSALSQSG